jgi:hypothetical protein
MRRRGMCRGRLTEEEIDVVHHANGLRAAAVGLIFWVFGIPVRCSGMAMSPGDRKRKKNVAVQHGW